MVSKLTGWIFVWNKIDKKKDQKNVSFLYTKKKYMRVKSYQKNCGLCWEKKN